MKNRITPITPGKPYSIRPYTFTLMEPGSIMINRNRKGSDHKAKWITCLLVLIACLGIAIRFFGFRENGRITENAALNYTDEKKHTDMTHRAGIAKLADAGTNEHLDMQTMKPESSLAMEKQPVKLAAAQNSFPTLVKAEKSSQADDRATPQIIEVPFLQEKVLEKALNSAITLIEQGELKAAGQVLKPLLPFVDSKQKSRIIRSLDPMIQTLYKRSQLIKYYEPPKYRETLANIANSGLAFLPACRKAMEILEDDKRNISSEWGY